MQSSPPPPPPPHLSPRLQDGLGEADDDEADGHHHIEPHAMDLVSQLPLASPLPSSVEGRCFSCDHGDGGTSTSKSTSAHSLTASVSESVSSNAGEHQLTQMPLSCNGKASAPPAFALHRLFARRTHDKFTRLLAYIRFLFHARRVSTVQEKVHSGVARVSTMCEKAVGVRIPRAG